MKLICKDGDTYLVEKLRPYQGKIIRVKYKRAARNSFYKGVLIMSDSRSLTPFAYIVSNDKDDAGRTGLDSFIKNNFSYRFSRPFHITLQNREFYLADEQTL